MCCVVECLRDGCWFVGLCIVMVVSWSCVVFPCVVGVVRVFVLFLFLLSVFVLLLLLLCVSVDTCKCFCLVLSMGIGYVMYVMFDFEVKIKTISVLCVLFCDDVSCFVSYM